MKIKSIKVIDGKNKWSESKDKLIHMVLDLGVYENKPSNKIEGFYERIKEHLPSLQSHRCSEGKAGGFFKRIKEGTWMGHIIEHVALELQTLAGMDTGWGRTRGVKGQKGVYDVVFNYVEKDKGKLAAIDAFNVVNDIIDNKNPQIDNIVKKLKPKRKIRESIRRILKEEINPKQDLYYEFKCTDADEDGIFYDTCFGEIDTTEFSQIIDDMENYEISKEEFKDKFTLTKSINKIINNPESEEWLEFYDKSDEDGYVVIFDGDIHYIYSV